MKTKEQLMAPRYQMISREPLVGFCFLDIIEDQHLIEAWDMKNLPHLFQKLEWYEERDTNDLPDYIAVEGMGILKVTGKGGGSTVFIANEGVISSKCCLPATQEEYEAYKKANA
ncbi:MAG: hypothetical protein ACTHMC_01285 [Pseudobacter sp.]|uniref:hypothetical protein n=1 Tax=Pseudobacter sp. TaxID=2045420 RepID=UPI003F7E841D